MNSITLFIEGKPVAQGSMNVFNGRAVHVNHKELNEWRGIIREAWIDEFAHPPQLKCPVALSLDFYLPRWKYHYSSNGELKPNRPLWRDTHPDLDKLARAVLDALTGVVYDDDKRVCALRAVKTYCDTPGVLITLTVLQTKGITYEHERDVPIPLAESRGSEGHGCPGNNGEAHH